MQGEHRRCEVGPVQSHAGLKADRLHPAQGRGEAGIDCVDDMLVVGFELIKRLPILKSCSIAKIIAFTEIGSGGSQRFTKSDSRIHFWISVPAERTTSTWPLELRTTPGHHG